ncbi:hypothetical protein DL771_006652 [Monosporascus sp. 5C6A]|nr:hypothetical protein DL771_006652 [Monosporascus sp. 5C6A]
MSLLGRASKAWNGGKGGSATGERAEEVSEEGFGFHTIIPKDPTAPEVVAIVAIHGLNGHYERTWTDEKTGVNWLRDCIAIGNARIMSFSYNSSVQFNADEQRNGATAVQCILRQLYENHPNLKPVGANYLSGRSFEDLEALWLAFIQSARMFERTRGEAVASTYCILDGLDECDYTDRKQLVRFISQFYERREPTQATQSDCEENGGKGLVKMIVFSRPDNVIKAAFDKSRSNTKRGSSAHTTMIRLRGEDETDAISADITRVVNASILDLVDQGLPDELLGDVKEHMIKRADRTFLWVVLILQLLVEKVETGASRRGLDAILESRTIDAVYSELLATRPDVSKTRKMLSVIIAAARPLTA